MSDVKQDTMKLRYTLPTDTLEQKKQKYANSIYPFNPELFSLTPTHMYNGDEVKAFKSTASSECITVEYMTGEFTGKITRANFSDLVPYTGPDRNTYEVERRPSDDWPSHVLIPESER